MKYKVKAVTGFKWGPEIDGKRNFVIDGAKKVVQAGIDRVGNYVTGLTPEDEEKFERVFSKPKGFYNNRSNFWCGGELFGNPVEAYVYAHTIDTGTDGHDKGKIIDTTESPMDEMTIKFLLAQNSVNHKGSRNNNAILEVESLEDKIVERVEFGKIKAKAYEIYNKLTEDNKRKYYTMITGKTTKGLVLSAVEYGLIEMIERSPDNAQRFVNIIEDKTVDEKFKYQQLFDSDVIKKVNGKYYFEDKELGKNFQEMYTYLNDKKNNETRTALMKIYMNSFEGVV